jgi:hypothetical protein
MRQGGRERGRRGGRDREEVERGIERRRVRWRAGRRGRKARGRKTGGERRGRQRAREGRGRGGARHAKRGRETGGTRRESEGETGGSARSGSLSWRISGCTAATGRSSGRGAGARAEMSAARFAASPSARTRALAALAKCSLGLGSPPKPPSSCASPRWNLVKLVRDIEKGTPVQKIPLSRRRARAAADESGFGSRIAAPLWGDSLGDRVDGQQRGRAGAETRVQRWR